MIVKRDEFKSVIKHLSKAGDYGLDTETYGLKRDHRLFSIIIADEKNGYYFNFNDRPDHLGNKAPFDCILPHSWMAAFEEVLENKDSRFAVHNAKYDMQKLALEELFILGEVHCTQAIERVLRNNFLGKSPYSLAACAKRRGLEKDESVDEYITKHKLFTEERIDGKDKPVQHKHFNLVPFPMMARYAETDGVLARFIMLDQIERIKKKEAEAPICAPKILPLVENENKLTKVCFRVEEAGAHIDKAYVKSALKHTLECAEAAQRDFKKMTGLPFDDGGATLQRAFTAMGITLPLTPKSGKPCTNKAVLDALDNPLADKIREIRSFQKLASTYYSSFLYYADADDLVHANIRQGGTETGRFSYSDPNLQNLPKEDDEEDEHKPFLVRRSFTPVNDDFIFVAIDFKQQEFRLMLDLAGEMEMIHKVLSGMDVHDATADMLGCTRKPAKSINFGLLYGMGKDKMARALKMPRDQSDQLRNTYFSRLPKVKTFITDVTDAGKRRGYIWNSYGFRNHIASSDFAYILPNHLIQGTCGQVIRIAMVRLDEYFRKHKLRSKIILQVHDELLFQVHRSEYAHIPAWQKIMESVYVPKNGLVLECSVEHSERSFAKWDMKKGLPIG